MEKIGENFGAYLTGAFGQSQDLYETRNEAKRERKSQEAVVQKIKEDAQRVIKLQQEASLDYVIDPMFNYYYLFQPLVEQVAGIEEGRQENWYNNNVFYRCKIHGPVKIQTGFSEKYLALSSLISDGIAMAILPSPYTFLERSEVVGYSNKKEAITNLAELLYAEAQDLVSKGIGRIQYDEPEIVVKQSLGSLTADDLELLRRGIEICGKINGATTSLHTYFGDAGPIIPFLNRLPVDCIGIDGTETSLNDILKHDYSGKEVALGLLDARNTSLEDSAEIAEQLCIVAERTNPRNLYLTPNAGTEYRGFTHGVNKLNLLKKVRSILHE